MTVCIALLRGINVGGHKKVNMAELKTLFESLGYTRVRTYINSGNVVYETAGLADEDVRIIERGIEERFGFPVSVITRTSQELQGIAAAPPFAEEGTPEELSLHVGFLPEVPSEERLDRIRPYVNEIDEFRVVGREMYVVFRAGVRDSKLGNNLSKLGIPVTLRNWNTVGKLAAMASEI